MDGNGLKMDTNWTPSFNVITTGLPNKSLGWLSLGLRFRGELPDSSYGVRRHDPSPTRKILNTLFHRIGDLSR
jgi:hypothetical protein